MLVRQFMVHDYIAIAYMAMYLILRYAAVNTMKYFFL